MTDKIKFGIIGTSAIVDTIIAAGRLDSRFEPYAIYSRKQERADEFGDKHNIAHRYTSLAEMLDNKDIDAIYIASPNHLHATHSIEAMNAGKHVLCEKPIASNLMEAKKMVATSRQKKLSFMEAMMPPYTPTMIEVKNNLEKLGKIRGYSSHFCRYSSKYDSFKEGKHINAFSPEFSGGATMDIGIYAIYPMLYLFGMPKSVKASGTLLDNGIDAQANVVFKYEEILGTVSYSKISTADLPTVIYGERASISINEINFPSEAHLSIRGEASRQIGFPPEKNIYSYELVEFLNIVEQGRLESSVASHQMSLDIMKLLDEIRRQIGLIF